MSSRYFSIAGVARSTEISAGTSAAVDDANDDDDCDDEKDGCDDEDDDCDDDDDVLRRRL